LQQHSSTEVEDQHSHDRHWGIAGVLTGISQRFATDLTIPIIVSILCAGSLGTARLTLDSHSPAQVYAGFFAGFLSSSYCWFSGKKYFM